MPQAPLRHVAILLALVGLAGPPAEARHVVIAVVDGPRHTEFLDEPGRPHLPRISESLLPAGTLLNGFRNEGLTATLPGHSAILTGTNQPIANDGTQRPDMPTLFERVRKDFALPATQAWIVGGKDKFSAVTYSTHGSYGAAYGASLDATLRSDPITHAAALAVLTAHRPVVTCVSYSSVDLMGHAGIWDDYLAAIVRVDSLLVELWHAIESDSVLGGDTDLFITSDHGRHYDAYGGFQNHGDSCGGCRTLPFIAVGPDIKVGATVTGAARMEDLAVTVAYLLGISGPPMEGSLLTGILANPPSTGVGGDTPLLPVLAAPNPFSHSLNVRTDGWIPTHVEVLDIRGRRILGASPGGTDTFRWFGRDASGREVPPGVYWVRLADRSVSRAVRVVRIP